MNENLNTMNEQTQATDNDIRELTVVELEHVGGGVLRMGYVGAPVRPTISVD
jgi:hypothetical protein